MNEITPEIERRVVLTNLIEPGWRWRVTHRGVLVLCPPNDDMGERFWKDEIPIEDAPLASDWWRATCDNEGNTRYVPNFEYARPDGPKGLYRLEVALMEAGWRIRKYQHHPSEIYEVTMTHPEGDAVRIKQRGISYDETFVRAAHKAAILIQARKESVAIQG